MSKFPPTDTHTHTLTTHAYALAHAIKYAVFFIVTAFMTARLIFGVRTVALPFNWNSNKVRSGRSVRAGRSKGVSGAKSSRRKQDTDISSSERTFLLLVIVRKFRLVTCGTFRSFRRVRRVRVVQRMKHVDGRNVSEQEHGGISREVVVTVTDVLSEPGLRCAHLRIGVCVLFESFPP